MWEELINTLSRWLSPISYFLESIWDLLSDISSYIDSILSSIWFWLTTLITSIWKLFNETIWNGGLSSALGVINDLWDYIGGPWVVFLCSILLIIFWRIIIAFVFKVFRLSLDYNTSATQWKESRLSAKNKDFQEKHREF